MAKMILSLVNLLALSSTFGFRFGGCGVGVKPVRSFHMDSMKGKWYVIEKSGDTPSCSIYNITESSTPGLYNLEISSITSYFGIKNNNKENKFIVVDNEKDPGTMTIKSSKNNNEKVTVFMTDYTNYAGLYSCHKSFFGHSYKAVILSRTPSLYKVYLEQVRSRLTNSKIDVNLSAVSQIDCPNRRCRGGFRYC